MGNFFSELFNNKENLNNNEEKLIQNIPIIYPLDKNDKSYIFYKIPENINTEYLKAEKNNINQSNNIIIYNHVFSEELLGD